MANPNFDPDQMHFFYKNKYLGSCEPGDAWCPKLLELMKSDPAVASIILDYMNSLGDPVFPVSEEDWGTPETDISKVDIEDLYNTFLQELDYDYRDFPDDFYVGGDYRLPDFEIFVGEVADDVQACGDISCSTKVSAASNYDTKIISKYLKTLFDDEAFGTSKSSSLNSFYRNNPNDPDIYMNRNGLSYNRRNNTIDLIGNTREEDTPVFKVIPQYSSTKRQGTYAPKMPKLIPIDEWNATHNIDACSSVTASTNDSNIVNKIYSVMMNYEYGYDPDMTDINSMLQELTGMGVHVDTSKAFARAWVSAHNKAERKTWGGSGDSMHYDSLTPGELNAIENYDTEYWERAIAHPFKLEPRSAYDVSSSTKYGADMCSITGTSGNLVYENCGDVNFADYGRLVAKDPDRENCYYVISCDPVYDTKEPQWSISENYIDLTDDWFDVSAIADFVGDANVADNPYELAMMVFEYYGSQNPYDDRLVSSAEGEQFLNSLNVNGEVYWGASV